MGLRTILIVSWLSACCAENLDDAIVTNMRRFAVKKEVPALFRRVYKEWSSDSTCGGESMKSMQAEVKLRGNMRYALKAKIPLQSNRSPLKVELWLEFHEIAGQVSRDEGAYTAEIHPIDTRVEGVTVAAAGTLPSERMLEIYFDVTRIYLNTKNLGKKNVHVRLRLFSRKPATDLSSSTLKAFLIIHEFDNTCELYGMDGRLRRPRSLDRHGLPSEITRSSDVLVDGSSELTALESSSKVDRDLRIRTSLHNVSEYIQDRMTLSRKLRALHVATTRTKRSTHASHNFVHSLLSPRPFDHFKMSKKTCSLKDWHVSFSRIGWDQWVIAPTGVMAYTCSGTCSFPMGSEINSTAHAHLQNFVYYAKGEKWPASCVPHVMGPLTMVLYEADDGFIFIARFPNMIAKSCACL